MDRRTNPMTSTEKSKFEDLPDIQARAQWLLDRGVSAQIDIDPDTLELVMRPTACGVLLPGKYQSEHEAIAGGTAFLKAKLG